MSEQSLKKKTAIAIAWSSFDKIGTQLVFFVIGILMARMLSQTEYGLVGMLGVFSAISSVLIDGGFSSALIRKVNATEQDYNSVFYFNIVLSSGIYITLFFSAPAIATFFHQPILIELSRVIFLSIIINSFGLIQATLLTKHIRFKQNSLSNVLSLLFSGIVALFLAYKGYGVWALVWQNVSATFFRVSLLWIFGKWYPKLIFSMASLKEQIHYSLEMTLAGFLGTIFQNIYSLIIGKFFPIVQLGNFTQASKMSDMPVNTLSGSIYNATFPIYSSIKDDAERLKRAFQKTIRFTSFITFPVLIGLASVGPQLLELLLTKKWEGSFAYFQLLCLAGIPTIFTAIIQNFVRINERVTIFIYFELAKIGILIVAFLSTIHFGIFAVVVGIVAMRYAVYFMNLIFIGHKVNYRWGEQLRDMLPCFAISMAMAALIYPLSLFIENKLLLVAVQIVTGALFYLATNKLLKSKVLEDVLSVLFKK